MLNPPGRGLGWDRVAPGLRPRSGSRHRHLCAPTIGPGGSTSFRSSAIRRPRRCATRGSGCVAARLHGCVHPRARVPVRPRPRALALARAHAGPGEPLGAKLVCATILVAAGNLLRVCARRAAQTAHAEISLVPLSPGGRIDRPTGARRARRPGSGQPGGCYARGARDEERLSAVLLARPGGGAHHEPANVTGAPAPAPATRCADTTARDR